MTGQGLVSPVRWCALTAGALGAVAAVPAVRLGRPAASPPSSARGSAVSHQSETGTVGFVGTRAGDDARVRRLRLSLARGRRPFLRRPLRRDASASPAAPPACGSARHRAGRRRRDLGAAAADLSRPARCSVASSPWSSTAPTGVLSVLGETSPSPNGRHRAPRSAPPMQPTPRSARSPAAHHLSTADLRASQPQLKLYDPRLLGAPSPFDRGRAVLGART